MENITEIQELYKKIPKSKCEKDCAKCCYDLIQVSKEESKRMGGYAWNGKCIHLIDNQCSVHEKRAFICRLYGTSEILRCSGCEPEYYLSESETKAIVNEYLKLMRS